MESALYTPVCGAGRDLFMAKTKISLFGSTAFDISSAESTNRDGYDTITSLGQRHKLGTEDIHLHRPAQRIHPRSTHYVGNNSYIHIQLVYRDCSLVTNVYSIPKIVPS